MQTDIRPNTYEGYARAVGAPSHISDHPVIAPATGQRAVAPENQTTTGSGYSPAVVDAAISGRRIPGGRTARGRPTGGNGRGNMMRLVKSPLVVGGVAALIIWAVFLRKS